MPASGRRSRDPESADRTPPGRSGRSSWICRRSTRAAAPEAHLDRPDQPRPGIVRHSRDVGLVRVLPARRRLRVGARAGGGANPSPGRRWYPARGGELCADVTKTKKDGTRGRLRIDYGDPRQPTLIAEDGSPSKCPSAPEGDHQATAHSTSHQSDARYPGTRAKPWTPTGPSTPPTPKQGAQRSRARTSYSPEPRTECLPASCKHSGRGGGLRPRAGVRTLRTSGPTPLSAGGCIAAQAATEDLLGVS